MYKETIPVYCLDQSNQNYPVIWYDALQKQKKEQTKQEPEVLVIAAWFSFLQNKFSCNLY